MIALVRSLLAPLTSLIFLIMASGLFNTFVSVRLEMEGYSNETIGVVVSALYCGILAGSIWLDQWISKYGHVRSLIGFACISTLLIFAQALWINPLYWSVIRFFGGICMAGIFIAIESWLLIQSSASMRGAILSLYLAIFYGALSIGQLLIDLSDPTSSYPFLISGSLSGASIIPLCFSSVSQPIMKPSGRLTLTQIFRISPLGFLGGVASGILLAAIYGLVPVYAKEVGMSISEIGNLMALIIFGGLSFQLPFGRWADRGNRRHVLLVASVLTTLTGIAIGYIDHESPTLLLFFAWFFGGFSFTIYPLSMAYTCEKLADEQIVPATGGFVLSYGIGAIAGPLLAPIAMDLMGNGGLFYFLSLISFSLVLFSLKKPTPAED